MNKLLCFDKKKKCTSYKRILAHPILKFSFRHCTIRCFVFILFFRRICVKEKESIFG